MSKESISKNPVSMEDLVDFIKNNLIVRAEARKSFDYGNEYHSLYIELVLLNPLNDNEEETICYTDLTLN